MLINKEFILASSSKSRFKILKQNKLNFKQVEPKCDEEKIKKKLLKNNNKPTDVVKILAREKTISVSIKNPKEITVGCDTIILLNKKMIQKAKNLNEAQKKITEMSGKKHNIISAVSVYKNKTLEGFIPALNQTVMFKVKNIDANIHFMLVKTLRDM